MSNEWHMRQLLRRVNPPAFQDGTGCGPRMLTSGQGYTPEDALAVAAWLAERATGYLNLRKFEGGKLYPLTPHLLSLGPERACFDGHCCTARRVEIKRANYAAYHGDIDGDGGY